MSQLEALEQAGAQLAEVVTRWLDAAAGRRVVVISGESGSGKTTVASAIVAALAAPAAAALDTVGAGEGRGVALLHMDDYYWLPPAENDAARQRDLVRVGPEEVDLETLSTLARRFLDGDDTLATRRLAADRRHFERASLVVGDARLLVIEGTFAALCAPPGALEVLVDRDHRSTAAGRLARGRDPIDSLTPRILDIEQRFVGPLRSRAHIVVDQRLSVEICRDLP